MFLNEKLPKNIKQVTGIRSKKGNCNYIANKNVPIRQTYPIFSIIKVYNKFLLKPTLIQFSLKFFFD